MPQDRQLVHRRAGLRSVGVVIGTVVGVVVTAGALTACTGDDAAPAEQRAAQRFLDAVAKGDPAAAAALTTTPTTARSGLRASLDGLGTGTNSRTDTRTKATLTATAAHTKGSASTVDFTASWTLAGSSSPWRYTGHVALTRRDGDWRVDWAPKDLHPGLAAGTHLRAARVQPERAALNAADGTPLFAATPVVRVGIEPRLVKDLDRLARTLAAVPQLQSTAAEIIRAVRAAASPTDFVPVITLRRSVYAEVRDRIHDLDGTVFAEDTQVLPPSAGFGEPLLGRVGPVTAEQVTASRGRLVAGDQAGIGGLQQALDSRLAGTPGVTVVAADASGTTARTLAVVSRPKAGSAVTLTLDRRTQTAAERALAPLSQAASVVAVQRSTGRILADANSAATTYDYGLAGAFPPGSTFKIATWTAAFTARTGLTPDSLVACPATTTVDGRVFENENRFSHPPIPISAAFGYSCNTSAIAQAMALPTDAVTSAARALGLGAKWSLPVTAFSGSAPTPAGPTEQAADAIGQGRVLASPLLMALMADAATSGNPVRPSLLAGTPVVRGTALPGAIPAKLTALMKATVDLPGGTGHSLDDLRGVEGKTGTAEYGRATPPRSHAWFAGVQGDVAFAVFVYDGASRGIDPTTVVHRFLDALA